MYGTLNEAVRAAHKEQLAKQVAQGRVLSPWVRKAVLHTLPAKELGHEPLREKRLQSLDLRSFLSP